MGTGEARRPAAEEAAAAGSAAISSLGLALLLVQLIDVFVRHQWGGSGPGDPILTAPVAPLPFLWPGDDSQLQEAAAAMLLPGSIAAILAIRSLLSSRRYPGLLSPAGRLLLTAGTAAATAQIAIVFLNVLYFTGSICDTVKLLPWLELSALLELVGAAVGLRVLIAIGDRTDRMRLKALSLGGATVGLGAAVIGLCIVTTLVEAVVGRQCPM